MQQQKNNTAIQKINKAFELVFNALPSGESTN